MLLAYNARYLSSYSLVIEEVQMAISPNLIFNTWRIARDWCLRKNIFPHYMHNQPFFPFWLLALSSMKGQWKILVKGSKVVSSPPPLSTNKTTRIESAVSVETVVSCDGVLGSLNAAVQPSSLCCTRIWQGEGGRWGLLICERIDMDEPAQCCSCSLCCSSKCCSMLQLDVERALDCHLCVERSKKVLWLNGYNKQIFLPNLTEEF